MFPSHDRISIRNKMVAKYRSETPTVSENKPKYEVGQYVRTADGKEGKVSSVTMFEGIPSYSVTTDDGETYSAIKQFYLTDISKSKPVRDSFIETITNKAQKTKALNYLKSKGTQDWLDKLAAAPESRSEKHDYPHSTKDGKNFTTSKYRIYSGENNGKTFIEVPKVAFDYFNFKKSSSVATSLFPEDSLGAKITNGMPQGTGAKSLEFPYKERVNQQNSTQTAFTPKEQAIEGLRPEDSTHQVITDKNAVAKAQERIDFDFEGEKADLPNKQDWDKNDTTTAQLILRKLTNEAQKSGDYSDVIKWNKTLTQHTSAQGQALQANAQFANTPEHIVADAAETLFGENTRKLSDEDKNNIMKTISDSADKLDNIKQGDTASVVSLIKDLNKIRKTTGLFSKETSAQVSSFLDYASKLPDGEAFLRDVAAQQIRNVASDFQNKRV